MNEGKYKIYYSAFMDDIYTVYFDEIEQGYFIFDGSGTYLMSKEQIDFNFIFIGDL